MSRRGLSLDYVVKILFLNKESKFYNNELYFEIILSIWGLPGVILEAHFGILEAPERSKNHIWGSKSILRRRL